MTIQVMSRSRQRCSGVILDSWMILVDSHKCHFRHSGRLSHGYSVMNSCHFQRLFIIHIYVDLEDIRIRFYLNDAISILTLMIFSVDGAKHSHPWHNWCESLSSRGHNSEMVRSTLLQGARFINQVVLTQVGETPPFTKFQIVKLYPNDEFSIAITMVRRTFLQGESFRNQGVLHQLWWTPLFTKSQIVNSYPNE